MRFELPMAEGQFIKRYKRFFADIEYEGETITAHVPNTGSLKTCLKEGAPCRFTISDDPKRKLKYSLVMIKPGKSWVGVNTSVPNQIVHEAYQNGLIKDWQKYKAGKREVKINDKSRLDLVLWNDDSKFDPNKKIDPKVFNRGEDKFHFIEVKNVTMCEDGIAKFPDAVTTRGQKHLEELMKLIDLGHTAEIVFTVQRTDAKSFSPAHEIDPKYSELLKQAEEHGVIVSPYLCKLAKNSIQLTAEKLKVDYK